MPDFTLSCPVPISNYPRVLMAHGGGGRLMRNLIQSMFAQAFQGESEHDAAVLPVEGQRLAMTTDSFVVKPLFFPGGDIGSLAVHGTVNDLAMAGATPRYLSAGFILEEGLEMETLWRVTQSMAAAARACGVRVVTGDTKVVERGHADGLYINTAGVGFLAHDLVVAPASIRPGDAILLSGDVGRHGMAIMASREGLSFESEITSDSAPVVEPVLAMLAAGIEVRCMRDLTRGGLASALYEIASSAGVSLRVEETRIAVREDVRGACEILGFDPFFVANEGRFVAFVSGDQAEAALGVLRGFEVSSTAARVGEVVAGEGGVVMRSVLGSTRIIELMSGEQLPRIC
jgi:hydrogenase expression/formation protein HypE